MATSIYQCDRCHFTFERVGIVQACPDCGSSNIRSATADERADYARIKEELALQKDKGDQLI